MSVGDKYEKNYSESSFWEKVKGSAKSAGKGVLEPALKMYYAAGDSETPIWAKSTVYGALGYFISPIDAIPDFTPVIGYSDDMGVLAAASAVIAASIKTKHVEKAKKTLQEWFG